jgi:hypothetical protein
MATNVVTLESVHASYPGWEIFDARGLWWATRPGEQVWIGPRSLILRLVAAETLDGLASKLSRQRYLESLGAEDLAAIYRRAIQPVEGES